MGFNKRFLSEESIKASAKNSFDSFETYMINADAYIISGDWANKIYHQFGEATKEERKKIHSQISKNQI